MIKNGRMSSGKKTKHIKAKFFFVKDRVDDREIKVFDCPTEEMWADVMTKPLQGTAFRVMRAELMNCLTNYEDPPEEVRKSSKRTYDPTRSVTWKSVVATTFKTPQECVEHNRTYSKREIDRCVGRTKHPHTTSHSGIRVARLAKEELNEQSIKKLRRQ